MPESLQTNTTVSHYRIERKLGAGGMGEVYLARDTRLERSVALKILPTDFASNQDRMRRFTQEAKAAAALNHPAIAHIYEIGASNGTHFIAMEYIDGVTLSEKIHREKVSLRKLLKYLAQAAEGLAKAHQAGIVHRDLKPDNIMISRDDYAKILDFGLAKLVEPQKEFGATDSASSEIQTAILEQHSTPGMIMGTAGYMSPEQAQGRIAEIDHRSDIFSFGCILYEAATRQKAFEGKDRIDSIHKIVHAPTPQIKDIDPSLPQDLQKIIRRCLAKEPEKRYHSIKDVAIELDDLQQELAGQSDIEYSAAPPLKNETFTGNQANTTAETAYPSTAASTDGKGQGPTSSAEYIATEIRRHKRGALVVAAALLILAALGIGAWVYRNSGTEQKKPEPSFQPAKLTQLTNTGQASNAAISPDGKYAVHVKTDAGRQSLWLRQVETTSDTQIVPPTDDNLAGIKFSHDGTYIYFVRAQPNSPGVLYQMPLLGGAARKIIDNVSSSIGLSPDGKRIAFRRTNPTAGEFLIITANADGSGEQVLATRKLPSNFGGSGLSWSPDGKTIATGALNVDAGGTYATLVGVEVESGAETRLTPERWSSVGQVQWLPDKSGLIFAAVAEQAQLSQIWHVSYPEGTARKITNDLNNYSGISITADSTALVTVQTEGYSNIWVAPLADSARARQITSGRTNTGMIGISWTPDGKLVYTTREGGFTQIAIAATDGTGQRLLTSQSRTNQVPQVTPDGRYIVFRSIRAGAWNIWRMDIDGGNLKQLTQGGTDNYPSVSPDGRWVVFSSTRAGVQSLWKVSIDGGEAVRLTEKNAFNGSVSPDGKLIACHYREAPNAPLKAALIPFEGGAAVRVLDLPTRFVGEPGLQWTTDGRALLYAETQGDTSNIWSLPIDGGQPKQITNFTADRIFWFELSPDGRQLALSRGTITSDVVLIKDFK